MPNAARHSACMLTKLFAATQWKQTRAAGPAQKQGGAAVHRRGPREAEAALEGTVPQAPHRDSSARGEHAPARALASRDASENADRNPSRTEGALLAMR